MTLHLHMSYKCSECGSTYIPYNETICCPKCGKHDDMEDYYPLVEGICKSFLYNIENFKDFFPGAWATMDISDTIQMMFFHIFNRWVKEHPDAVEESTDEDFRRFSDGVIDGINFKKDTHMLDFLKQLCLDVYEEFFHNMGIVLTVDRDLILIEKGGPSESEEQDIEESAGD